MFGGHCRRLRVTAGLNGRFGSPMGAGRHGGRFLDGNGGIAGARWKTVGFENTVGGCGHYEGAGSSAGRWVALRYVRGLMWVQRAFRC